MRIERILSEGKTCKEWSGTGSRVYGIAACVTCIVQYIHYARGKRPQWERSSRLPLRFGDRPDRGRGRTCRRLQAASHLVGRAFRAGNLPRGRALPPSSSSSCRTSKFHTPKPSQVLPSTSQPRSRRLAESKLGGFPPQLAQIRDIRVSCHSPPSLLTLLRLACL